MNWVEVANCIGEMNHRLNEVLCRHRKKGEKMRHQLRLLALVATCILFTHVVYSPLVIGGDKQSRQGDQSKTADNTELVKKLRVQLLSKIPEERENAVGQLFQVGPSAAAALPEVIKAVFDEDERFAESAGRAMSLLNRIGEPAFPKFVEILKNGTARDKHRMLSTLPYVYRSGNSQLDDAICEALRDKDELRYHQAAYLLCKFPIKKALPILLDHLNSSDPDFNSNQHIIIAVGLYGSEARAAIPHLFRMARKRSDGRTNARPNAIESLGRVGSESKEVAACLHGIFINKLDDIYARTSAAIGLGFSKFGNNSVPDLLVTVFEPNPSTENVPNQDADLHRSFRIHALETASQFKIADSRIPELLALFKNENVAGGLKSASVRALGKMGSIAVDAVPSLLEAIDDSRVDVSFFNDQFFGAVASIVGRDACERLVRERAALSKDAARARGIVARMERFLNRE